MSTRSPSPAFLTSPFLPAIALVAAIGIFLIDTLTPLGIAVAVLYVVVLFLAASFLERHGVLIVAAACVALTVGSYLLVHGYSYGWALVRAILSLVAIGVTTFLILRNQADNVVLREQAGLLDVTHDAVFVRDMNDKLTYWNRGATELYGWSSNEAIGQISHQLLRSEFPEPLEAITAELLRTGRWEGEFVHTKRDGTTVLVASRWSLQRDLRERPIAVLETNNDIGERKQAQDALLRSEAYLAEAQRLSATGSFGWDLTSGALYWSEETYRIFGYPLETKPSLELVRERTHPDDLARVNALLERIPRDPYDWELEHRLLMPDGSVKQLRVFAHAVRDAQKCEYIGAVMDITASREAENQLQEARAELAHVNRVSTLGEFVASIAHEVNQPIAAVVTNAGAGLRWLSAAPPNIEEVHLALSRIVNDGNRASEVLQRIRSLVKKAPLRREEFDINDAIREVIDLTRNEVQRNSIRLDADLAPGLPHIPGDRVQIQQVLLNLIVNAIEAMSAAQSARRDLTIRSTIDAANGVLVSVQDSGPGLDAASLDRLFRAFYTTKAEGLGMGLPISRSIIEAHGGKLWATSDAGRGATFQVSLPAGHADPA